MPKARRKTVTIVLRVSRQAARLLLGDWPPIYRMGDPWAFLNGLRVAARRVARERTRK